MGDNRCLLSELRETQIHCEAEDKIDVTGNEAYNNHCLLRGQELC